MVEIANLVPVRHQETVHSPDMDITILLFFTLAFILGGLEGGMIGLNDNRRSAIVSSRFFLCIDL